MDSWGQGPLHIRPANSGADAGRRCSQCHERAACCRRGSGGKGSDVWEGAGTGHTKLVPEMRDVVAGTPGGSVTGGNVKGGRAVGWWTCDRCLKGRRKGLCLSCKRLTCTTKRWREHTKMWLRASSTAASWVTCGGNWCGRQKRGWWGCLCTPACAGCQPGSCWAAISLDALAREFWE